MSEVKIPENVRAIADAAKKELTIKDGQAELDKEFYESTLPEGVDMKTVKKVHSHDSDYVSGLALAFGENATAEMKKDKKLEEVKFSTNMVKDNVRMTFTRQYEKAQGIPEAGKDRQTTTAYGGLSVGYTKSGASGSKGSLKKVRTILGEAAAEALK